MNGNRTRRTAMKAFQSDECSWQAAGDGAEGRGPGFIVVRRPTPRVRFSAHALLRMAERGISRGEAEAVLIHGMEMPVRGGLAYSMGDRELDLARAEGIDVAGLRGIVVILAVDDSGSLLVTAYRSWELGRLLKRSRVVSRKRGRNGRRKRGGKRGLERHELAAQELLTTHTG
jgi:hypothetical protein